MPRRYESEVNAGIIFLDDHEEQGWRRRLIGVQLNMRFPNTCVLGHLHTNFWSALGKLGLSFDDAMRFGFALPRFEMCDLHWLQLTDEWEHQLAAPEEV